MTSGQYKSALSDNEDMAKSASKTTENVGKQKAPTVYSQKFLVELEDRGILDQQYKRQGCDLDMPSNYEDIRKAIVEERPKDEANETDYEEYMELVWEASNETATEKVYSLFFGDFLAAKQPHRTSYNERWLSHEPITGELNPVYCKQVPHPDLAEGLRETEVPRWIRERLCGYAPRAKLAFPNFVVQLKRDQSMFVGHVQSRHCGAVASQAFLEYYIELHGNAGPALNTARVGSIEFNGDVIVGNVHWVSSSDKSGRDREARKYHIARVMCRFTCGLSFEDFKIARKEARNFREYFLNERVTFLNECKNLKRHRLENERSISTEVEAEENSEDNPNEAEENREDDDATNDQQQADRPPTTQVRRSTPKRKEHQAAIKDGGHTSKRLKPGQKKSNVRNDGLTGLT